MHIIKALLCCPLVPYGWVISLLLLSDYFKRTRRHDDSSNGNIFRVTGPWIHRLPTHFPRKGQSRGTLMCFFNVHLNKRLNKQWSCRWFETPRCSLWRQCNVSRSYWHYGMLVSSSCSCRIWTNIAQYVLEPRATQPLRFPISNQFNIHYSEMILAIVQDHA